MVFTNGTIRSAFGGRSIEKPDWTHAKNSSHTLIGVGADTENARYSAAATPIRDIQKYFSPERMPSGSL